MQSSTGYGHNMRIKILHVDGKIIPNISIAGNYFPSRGDYIYVRDADGNSEWAKVVRYHWETVAGELTPATIVIASDK